MKTVEFSVNSPKAFTSYLQKFASIDSTLLFEVDLEQQQFISKTPNEERSIVKYAVLPFSDAGFTLKGKGDIRIKVGVYNISRLISIIEQFGNSFEFVIRYDEIMGSNNQKDYAAISLLIKNDELKFNTECTSLTIFKYISDTLYTNTIRKIDEIASFDIPRDVIEKVLSLSKLDKDYKLIEFRIQNGVFYAKGKSFKLKICPLSSSDAVIDFYKEQFQKVDVENCRVIMGVDRMLFSSTENISETIISKVEGNDKFEETVEDF